MNAAAEHPERDPAIAKRRRILYAITAVVAVVIAAVAVTPLLKDDTPKKKRVVTPTPVIVARIDLKPVRGASGGGLAEVLRRNERESLRVLAAKLTPNKEDQAYQLVLTGGNAKEKLLGTAVVGQQRIFVGESKIGIDELEEHRRIELQRVDKDPSVPRVTVLRGKIPR